MYLFRRGLTAALFILSLASLSAQDVEIVVTATKEPTPAETLPVEVVVLDGEALKDKATVAEALESTLAVRLDTSLPGQETLVAPGFGENGFARISFLIDGVSQGNSEMRAPPLNLVPLFALDRIEVVRGPTSAFYGGGAVAGAVNLVTKIPRAFSAEASAGIDSNLTNRQFLGAGIPLGSGGLLLSVSRDQFLPSRDRSDSDQYQVWSKISVPYVLGGLDQDLSAWASFSRGQFQLPGAILTAVYEADPTRAAKPSDQGLQTESKGMASWTTLGPGWSVSIPVSATYRSLRSESPSALSYTDSGYTWTSLEPRFSAALGSVADADLEWTGGADLGWSQLVVQRYGDAFVTQTITATVDRWAGAGWTRLEASWDDRLVASVSGRIEGTRTTAVSKESPQVDGEKIILPWAAQAGLSWLISEQIRFGIEGARVYRYPFTDEMITYYGPSQWGNFDKFYGELNPETGYSGSARVTGNDGPFEVAASATYLSMEDEIILDETFTNVNAGKTWHLSSLLQTSYALGESLLGLEYSLEAARFANGAYDGKDIPLVPLHRGRIWSKVVWDHLGSLDLSASATSQYLKGGDNANQHSPVQGSLSLEAGMTVLFGADLTLKVYGKNLTNDRTPTTVYLNQAKTDAGYYPVEGRTFGATLGWKL